MLDLLGPPNADAVKPALGQPASRRRELAQAAGSVSGVRATHSASENASHCVTGS